MYFWFFLVFLIGRVVAVEFSLICLLFGNLDGIFYLGKCVLPLQSYFILFRQQKCTWECLWCEEELVQVYHEQWLQQVVLLAENHLPSLMADHQWPLSVAEVSPIMKDEKSTIISIYFVHNFITRVFEVHLHPLFSAFFHYRYTESSLIFNICAYLN